MKRTDKLPKQVDKLGVDAKVIRYSSGRKPGKCPHCGSLRIANILYGEPAYSERLMADIKTGKIILGGCLLTMDDPKWQCVDCNTEIYKK